MLRLRQVAVQLLEASMRAQPYTLMIPFILLLGGFLAKSADAGPLKALAFKGGAYYGTQDYDFAGAEIFDPGSTWTGTLGFSTEWKFSRKSKIHFLLEAQYLPKEIQEDLVNSVTARREEATVGLDYLSVPVLAKLRTADTASSLYFLVGFSVDFVLDRDTVPQEDLNQVFQDFNDTQFSVLVGLGIEHSLGRHFDLLIEYRYTQNVANIYQGNDLGQDVGLNGVRQRGSMFLAGMRYRIGRL
jgi:opacity protein-like surface antigen